MTKDGVGRSKSKGSPEQVRGMLQWMKVRTGDPPLLQPPSDFVFISNTPNHQPRAQQLPPLRNLAQLCLSTSPILSIPCLLQPCASLNPSLPPTSPDSCLSASFPYLTYLAMTRCHSLNTCDLPHDLATATSPFSR